MSFYLNNQFNTRAIGTLTAAVTRGATITSLTTSELPNSIIQDGTKLILQAPDGTTKMVTASAPNAAAAKIINIDSVTIASGFPIGTMIYFEASDFYNKTLTQKKYNFNQQIVFSGGTTDTNDYLRNYSHDTQFNINTSASLSNGDSKNNNWGARYGFFVAPVECNLTKVFGWINGHGVSSSKPEAITLSIWKKDSTANGTTATRIYLLSQTTHTFPASSANNYVEQIIDTPSPVAINKYDSCFVTIRRIGDEEHDRTATWYLNFEVIFEATQIN
tara:strand:- start:4880 stop:5704 length:825 start_codon:yes stop_codon:yes gene_type:complete